MRIAIFQHDRKHTEIMGTFIEYCLINHIPLDIFTQCHKDRYSFVPYYQALFGNSFLIYEPKEIFQYYKQYSYIIVNTNSDTLPPCFINDKKLHKKIIYVSHQNYHNKNFMLKNIIVSPNIVHEHYKKHETQYILPIYKMYQDISFNEKKNVYAIIGALREHGHDREIRHLIKLVKTYGGRKCGFKIRLYMRDDDLARFRARCPTLLESSLIEVRSGMKTAEMINELRTVKFLMPLARNGGWFHNQRLTGTIPMSLNMNIPMICDTKLNEIYGLEGNLLYDFDDYDESFMKVFEKSLTIDLDQYTKLVENVMETKNKIVDINHQRFFKLIDENKGKEDNGVEAKKEVVEEDNGGGGGFLNLIKNGLYSLGAGNLLVNKSNDYNNKDMFEISRALNNVENTPKNTMTKKFMKCSNISTIPVAEKDVHRGEEEMKVGGGGKKNNSAAISTVPVAKNVVVSGNAEKGDKEKLRELLLKQQMLISQMIETL